MPNIGFAHPYVIHGAIGFLLAGVLLRLIAIPRRWSWANPAAALFLILGAGAAVVAVRSGTDAHAPVERIPGVREAVMDHEEWGERTRNVFLFVALLEVGALALPARARAIRLASAAVGVVGAVFVVITGDLGGDIVYEHGGGPGLRWGSAEDIHNTYKSGLYNEAMLDRREGKSAEAAQLIDELAKRWPNDPDIRVLRIESRIRDAHDGVGALAMLDSMAPPTDNPRAARSLAILRANALVAAGKPDSARAILQELIKNNPGPLAARYQAMLDSIK
jgi:uncharacterized membrane protein